jgi:hypothetical protein
MTERFNDKRKAILDGAARLFKGFREQRYRKPG